MIKRVVLSLFAFAVLSAFALPDYIIANTPSGFKYSYTYDPNSTDSDFVGVFGFPSDSIVQPWGEVEDVNGDSIGSFFWEDPFGDDWELSTSCYVPSNPAYADFPVAPDVDPLIGDGGGSSGDGEGGFDPVGSLGSFGSVLVGIATALGGLLLLASGLCLSFLVWRKFRYSSKRV